MNSKDNSTLSALVSGMFYLIVALVGKMTKAEATTFIAAIFAIVTIILIINALIKSSKVQKSSPVILLLVVLLLFVIFVLFTSSMGPWSEWNTTPVSSSLFTEVEVRDVSTYNMQVYVTQEVSTNYPRNFRDYSIGNNYEAYNCRASYGEKHFVETVTQEQLKSAAVYASGAFIPNNDTLYVGGYNRSSLDAYVMQIPLDSEGRYYPLFIESEETITEYRYRENLFLKLFFSDDVE